LPLREVGGGVRRAYKFRLRPTARQHVALGQCLTSHRELYNAALQERRDAWRLRRTSVSYGDQSAQLKTIRAVRPDVAAWSFSSQQSTLRRLNRAFASFYRRVKAGETPGYPRFKSAHRFDSVEWPKDGDGCRWDPDTHRVYLQGIGHLKVTVHRQVHGRVKTIQVRREGRHWMLILSCDNVPIRPLEPTRAAVGVDVGIASFATTSDGQHLSNPGWWWVGAAKLGAAQQALARKRRGSNNRRRARATLAARHRKLANQRRNFHHHTARALVADYDLLVVEDLRIRNMVRRPASRPDPDRPGGFLPNRAAAKTGLNRSIHDAGWAQFVSILRAKAEEAGRVVIDVDPRHTSDRCEACGHTARENRVSQAVFSCQRCGHTVNADEHAARNILRAGLARLAAHPAA
jgi:putative transposase